MPGQGIRGRYTWRRVLITHHNATRLLHVRAVPYLLSARFEVPTCRITLAKSRLT